MFNLHKPRTVIFDDMSIFKKHDKINYKHIICFSNNNESIKKILIYESIYSTLKLNDYYIINITITPNTLKLLNIHLPNDILHNLIIKYNSNIFKIKKHYNDNKIYDDTFHSNEKIIYNLLNKKYDIYQINTIITHNDTMIILCLLELIIYNIPLNYNTYIKDIYNNYVLADIYEKYLFTYNFKFLRDYILYITCFSTHYINVDRIYINYKSFNTYNSKSSIICQKFYNYNKLSLLLNDIYQARESNNTQLLKKYSKYKKIFKDIYNITF